MVLELGDDADSAANLQGSSAGPAIPLTVAGGSGRDRYAADGNVSLDDVANDGPTGQDDIRSDVETLANTTVAGDDHFVGSSADNSLASLSGVDVMDGAAGDDYINTRDIGTAPPDQVTCGPGSDVAVVDDNV